MILVNALEWLFIALFIVIAAVLGGPIGFIFALVVIAAIRGPRKPKPSTILEEYVPSTVPSLYDIERELFEQSDKTTVPTVLYKEYRDYLKTPEWKSLRKEVFKRDNYRCVRCGYIGTEKQVHHTHYDGIFTMTFTTDQLETVCFVCHDAIHRGELPMTKD